MNAFRPIALIALILAATAGNAATVETADDLALQFADAGDLQAVLVDGRALPANGLTGGFHFAEVQPGGEELVTNASLEEDADADGVPDGFVMRGDWARDDAVARTGDRSVRIEVPGPDDAVSGDFGVIVPVEGGGTYIVSFYLRARGRAGQIAHSTGYVQQQDAEGARTTNVFQHTMAGGASGDSNWQRVSYALTTEGDTRRLWIRTNIYRGIGTLWADDFSVIRLGHGAIPLPTRAEPAGDGLRITGREHGLQVDATLTPDGNSLRLSGTLRSTEERERCITLAWRLPIAASAPAPGGVWWNDIGTPKTIEPGGTYTNAAPMGSYGPFSVYPFSSVVTADASAAVSLAVPMDPPRPFRIGYDAAEGLTIEWDLALSALPEQFPRSADFHAVIYRHDPAWGFRSAAERYYDLFPASFEVRVPKFGNWYYADLSELPNPEDFGLAYNEYIQPGSAESDHALGNVVFAYTEPWGWWGWALGLKPSEDDPQPSYEEMLATLQRVAGEEELLGKPGQNRAKVAQTIINSGVQDADGRYRFMQRYVARWGGFNWVLNPSPWAVEEGLLSRFIGTYEWEIERKLGWGADGIYLDSITKNWCGLGNYREEHLRRTRHPLTFSALDAEPVQLGMTADYEFTQYLSEDLHARGKLLMANIFPNLWVFFNHQLDVMGHEVWGAEHLDLMRAERTLAHHKPYCWLMQQGEEFRKPEDREKWMQAAMLYAIMPNVVGGAKDPATWERWRPLYRTYMPTIIALAEAGWEPVTLAQAETEGILVERFGGGDGPLYLTARNTGEEPTEATIAVDWQALGCAAPASVTRLPAGGTVALTGRRIVDTIGPGETCAYELIAP